MFLVNFSINSICLNCLGNLGEANSCPHCGAHGGKTSWEAPALKPGTRLAEKYLLGRALGRGGFAFTYLGMHIDLGICVAIKEFFPQELAERDMTTNRVIARQISHTEFSYADHYTRGLQRFIEEGRNIVRCHEPVPHPNLVRVTDYFEANGTAYLVMNYVKGVSLAEHLKSQPKGRLNEETASGILVPVMDGLRVVHERGFCHRDVKPANIYLSDDGLVILIDFGAARTSVQQESLTQTVFLTPGYAPPEQYSLRGVQGPWTDVYGCAATLYRCLTGIDPVSAMDRLAGIDLTPPSSVADCRISEAMENVICIGLESDCSKRPQTIKAYQEKLLEAVATPGGSSRQTNSEEPTLPLSSGSRKFNVSKIWKVALVTSILLLAVVAVTFFLPLRDADRLPGKETSVSPENTVLETISGEDIAEARGQAERAREAANSVEIRQYAAEEWEKANGLLNEPSLESLPPETQLIKFREIRETFQKVVSLAEQKQKTAIDEAHKDTLAAREKSDTVQVHTYATEEWDRAEELFDTSKEVGLTPGTQLARLKEAQTQFENAITSAAEKERQILEGQQENILLVEKEVQSARQQALNAKSNLHAKTNWNQAEDLLKQASNSSLTFEKREELYGAAKDSFLASRTKALTVKKEQEEKAKKEQLARAKKEEERKRSEKQQEEAKKVRLAHEFKGKAEKARADAQSALDRKSREFAAQSRVLSRNTKYKNEIEPLLNKAEQLWNSGSYSESAEKFRQYISKIGPLEPESFTSSFTN